MKKSSLSGFKKHTDGSVNFHWEILPVTCGEMKGMLHKNKFKQGRFHSLL